MTQGELGIVDSCYLFRSERARFNVRIHLRIVVLLSVLLLSIHFLYPQGPTESAPPAFVLDQRASFSQLIQFLDTSHNPQTGAILIQFQIRSELSDTSSWILAPGSWDRAVIKVTGGDQVETTYLTGHYVPKSKKPAPYWITYPEALYVRNGTANQIPLFLQAGETLDIEIMAWQPSHFPVYSEIQILPPFHSTFREDLPLLFLQLVFLGIILALVLYHGMQYFIVRDSSYLFYGLYMLSIAFHMLEYSGIVSEVFIPESPYLKPYIKTLIDLCLIVSYLQLFRVFIDTKKKLPDWDRKIVWLLRAFYAILPLAWLWLALGGNSFYLFLTMPGLSIFPVVIILVMTRLILRIGGKPGRYFMAGTAWIIVGTLLNLILTASGVIDREHLGEFSRIHFLQVGAIMELMLFAVGIGHKIRLNELAKQKANEVNQLQARFIANLSHEFRSPLTMIMGPAEDLLSQQLPDQVRSAVRLIQQNAHRLLGQVNELLNLVKLESGGILLQAEAVDLVQLLVVQTAAFESMARAKEIRLSFNSELKSATAWIDSEKFEKIIANLISNAIKFTPNSGKVVISLTEKEEQIQITVSDSGPGISSADLPFIFDRFYQVESLQEGKPAGTGIGLAFSKELVALHHAQIQVKSKEGLGTQFIILLKKGKAHLSPQEIRSITPLPKKEDLSLIPTQPPHSPNSFDQSPESPPPMEDESLPQVLVVEDNPDLRAYIRDTLRKHFRVAVANDGLAGWKKANELHPDLIVSDIMMPKMDGNELCARLKSDPGTNYIPVILLTARAEMESRLKGLETGADDYIIKPFYARELQLRSINLIEQRKRLRIAYSNWVMLPNAPLPESPKQEHAFVIQVKEILERQHGDADFSVGQFADEMAMSRKNLLRKTKTMMNTSPSDLIRNFRLEQAARLLQEHEGAIADVAYQVGYNNLSYFSKVFRETYGQSPSHFVENFKQK